MLMNWYVRNLSSSGDVAPSAPTTWALVRNSFNHSIPVRPLSLSLSLSLSVCECVCVGVPLCPWCIVAG
jgi:hypothetical protein